MIKDTDKPLKKTNKTNLSIFGNRGPEEFHHHLPHMPQEPLEVQTVEIVVQKFEVWVKHLVE